MPYPELLAKLQPKIEALKAGGQDALENLLSGQAVVLNNLFQQLTSQALAADTPEMIETLLSLGLKAQEQSRRSVLAIAELKNPKRGTVFISNKADRQLNQFSVPTLEPSDYAPLDSRTTGEAAPVDSTSSPLGKSNRANQ